MILPKKEPLYVCKCKDYIQLILAPDGEFIFFQCRSGPFIPTLHLLHRYPDILPKYRVDRGAIRFVLSGANIMSPGLTSAGGEMDDVPADSVIAVMAEGKEHALAIGVTTKSTEQIRSEKKARLPCTSIPATHLTLPSSPFITAMLHSNDDTPVFSTTHRHVCPPIMMDSIANLTSRG